jgi:CHAD domain-containing protein
MLEQEIKFRIPEGSDATAVRDAIEDLGFVLESSGTVVHEDRYLDTDDWMLYRAGLALRLRNEDGRVQLQAKTVHSQSDAVLARREWTQDAPITDPPWGVLPDGPVASLLKPLARLRVLERLGVRARVKSEREMFRWRSGQEILGSVTLDRVFRDGSHNGDESYRELEVEALDGASAKALVEVREAVKRRLDLVTSAESKLAAALTQAGEKLPDHADGSFALYGGDRLVDTAAKTLGRHLTRLFWNEPGTRLNLDPKYLHDMRVAARRLRTALLVFLIAIPEDTRESLGQDLRWIGRALGRIRDLDVGLKRVASMAARAPEHERAALYVLARYLEIKRARRRRRLLRRFDSKRFEAFRDRAHKWIVGIPDFVASATTAETADPGTGPVSPALAPAYMVGPRIVAEWDNRMRDACQEAERKSTPANVHALRIAVKHARYAVEYFTASEGQGAHQRAKQLARIQDKLGEHQDAATLLRQVRRYARTIPRADRELLMGVRGVLDRLEPEVRITRAELHELWELGAGADVS